MQFTITLLSLASLGLNILPAQSAAVPVPDLARRAEESINHVYRSDTERKRHVYGVDADEIAHTNDKRHVYGVDSDEIAHNNEKRHVYGVDADEIAHTNDKRHVYGVDSDEIA
ncbi:hypothetical protein EJ02DRAFT_222554 [Clathrospora elynae]|uniref:Uncharacterized protein n=1 Tax=Clathrospora elynae TaxID=706981 RepID=A0A6A5SJ66_9PLEO|nr:hypothetical protein EJ02DRAFT_222554 [Clathrospora elynae]